MKFEELREECYRANQEIVEAGLVLLTWGNASVRSDDGSTFAIKPSGVPYSTLSPNSMVLLDIDTGVVVEGNLRPSSDTPTHLELYRAFPTVKAIVHTHSHHAVVFAQGPNEVPILGTTHADHFRHSIPVTRAMTSKEVAGDYEAATGRVIVECFSEGGISPDDVPGVLVAHHGPFAWGQSAKAAVENAVVLEECARMALHTVMLRSALQGGDAAASPSPAAALPGGQPKAAGDGGNPDTAAPSAGVADRAPRYLTERHFLRKHGKGAYYGQK